MNNHEAIKSLENIVEYWTYKPTEVEAATMAIKALKKEDPQKPKILTAFKVNEHSDVIDKSGQCPACNTPVQYSHHMKYCPWCGQKLDWD
jgi:hypothetical protein